MAMKLRRKIIPVCIGLVIMCLCIWARVTTTDPFKAWLTHVENVAYDIQFKLKDNEVIPKEKQNIAIVDIDEKSLAYFGRWPWPRDDLAKLVAALQEQGAVVIAFDVVLSKADTNIAKKLIHDISKDKTPNEELVKMLDSLVPQYDYDTQLANALGESDVVLGFIFHDRGSDKEGYLPEAAISLTPSQAGSITIPNLPGYISNVEQLQKAGRQGGFLTAFPDPDGVIRTTPLVLRKDNNVYLSLGLEAARLFLLIDDVKLNIQQYGQHQVIEGIKLGKVEVPTDEFGRVNVPYIGPAFSFPYYSAADVVQHKLPKGALENKIVFLGTSALGMGDLRATPVGSVYPGVEVHANVAQAIIQGGFPSKPSWALGAEVILILVVGILCSFVFPYLSAGFLTFFSVLTPVLLSLLSYWLWTSQGLILSFVVTMFMVIALASMNMTYGFLFESRAKNLLKFQFGQYVPQEHVEHMSHNPKDYGMEGEAREMTVLFADIRNFTTISESLGATELKNLLNEFFTPMTKIIFEHKGTIDKYVGDMIMAFWGAPLEDKEHAKHAIAAAVEMVEHSIKICDEFVKKGLPAISIGVGLNTGVMNVGDMGSEFRRSYTVLGDAVNLASRLEGLTKFYGVSVVVGEQTAAGQDHLAFRLLDKVKVKGKNEAVNVYEPLGEANKLSQDTVIELRDYDEALRLYYKRKFDKAQKKFKKLKKRHPKTKIYQVYLERIKHLAKKPPGKKWDGAYTRTEK